MRRNSRTPHPLKIQGRAAFCGAGFSLPNRAQLDRPDAQRASDQHDRAVEMLSQPGFQEAILYSAAALDSNSMRPRSRTSCSRIKYFCTFFVTVIGNESTNRTYCGILKYAIFPRQYSR